MSDETRINRKIKDMAIRIKDALDIPEKGGTIEDVEQCITALLFTLAPLYYVRRRGERGMPDMDTADHLMMGAMEGMGLAFDDLDASEGPAAGAVQRVAHTMCEVLSGQLDGRYTVEDFQQQVEKCMERAPIMEHIAVNTMGKTPKTVRGAVDRAESVMLAVIESMKACRAEQQAGDSVENN